MDSPTTTNFWLHDWHVDPTLGRITRGRDSVQLGAQQIRVLLLLSRSPRLTLSQDQIEAAVWGDEPAVDGLYRCIAQLRAAFGDQARQPRFIQTVPRQGYRLIAPIHYEPTVPQPEQARASPPEPRVNPRVARTQLQRIASLSWPTRGQLRSVIFGISAAALLTTAICWFIYEQQRAADESANATQLTQFMQDVFAANAATLASEQPGTASQLLESAMERLAVDLKNQPLVRTRMLEAIGRSYLHRHLAEPALPALEEALRIRRHSISPLQPEAALTLTDLGEALRSLNRAPEAEHAYREALDVLRTTQRQPSRDFAATFGRLGSLTVEQGELTGGLRMLDTSLQQMQEIQGHYHSDTASLLVDLGRACQCLSDLGRAARALSQAQRIYQGSTLALDPRRLAADHAAGQVLVQQQRFGEAAVLLERTLAARRQLFGPSGIPIAETLNLLASVRNGQGRLEEATELKLAALAALDNLGEAAKLQRASIQLSLATLLMRTQQFVRSEELLHEVIALYDAVLPADHISRTSAEHYLGETLLEQKKYPEATAILQTAIQRMQRAEVPRWRISRSMSALGEALHRQGHTEAARSLLLESHAQLIADSTAKHTARAKARQRVKTLIGEPRSWAGVLSRR